MIEVYFLVFVVLTTALIAASLARPARIFEYPYFMAFAFAVFIAPQAWVLTRFPGGVKDSAVEDVFLMASLCIAACYLGYQIAPNKAIVRWASRPIDTQRLFHIGVIYTAIALALSARFGNIDVETAENGGMTGIATILLFFIQLGQLGFAICFFSALKKPSITHITWAAISVIPQIQIALFGRREPAALLALTVGAGLFFIRGVRPTRLVIAASVLFAMIAIPLTGAYRSQVAGRDMDNIREIEVKENLQDFLTTEGILELRNAAAVIEATRGSGDYQLGKAYWNHLVFRYVPAQFLGADFKQGLMFQTDELEAPGQTALGFVLSRGSTLTGMGDTFQQFGWLGCLFFVLPAILYRSIWKACREGHIYAQILYATTISSAMRAVTHWSLDFLPGFLYYLIFLEIARLYAKKPSRPSSGTKLPSSAPRSWRSQPST